MACFDWHGFCQTVGVINKHLSGPWKSPAHFASPRRRECLSAGSVPRWSPSIPLHKPQTGHYCMCVNNSCYRNSNSYSPGKLLWLSKGPFSRSLSARKAEGAAVRRTRDKQRLELLPPVLLAGGAVQEPELRVRTGGVSCPPPSCPGTRRISPRDPTGPSAGSSSRAVCPSAAPLRPRPAAPQGNRPTQPMAGRGSLPRDRPRTGVQPPARRTG